MDGEAQDPVAWLRRRIEERLYLARHAIELGNAAEWTEMSSGVLLTSPPDAPGTWDGVWATGDSSLTRLMEANDPRDTIARCETELAILDEHYLLTNEDRSEAYEEYSVVPWGAKGGAGDQGSGCVTCHYSGMGGVKGYGICRTVRYLLAAYRHRSGYDTSWGITPASSGSRTGD